MSNRKYSGKSQEAEKRTAELEDKSMKISQKNK